MEDSKDILLIDEILLVQKFEGKGGWTYVALPNIPQHPQNPFGWLQVKGSIDSYQLSRYKLMPMGNGHLFLPLKAEVRKLINKTAGDFVHVKLCVDDSKLPVPEEFLSCLSLDDKAQNTFEQLSESQKERFIKWIFSSKNQDLVIDRMAQSLKVLSQGLKMPPH